jgi:hypothetical protein
VVKRKEDDEQPTAEKEPAASSSSAPTLAPELVLRLSGKGKSGPPVSAKVGAGREGLDQSTAPVWPLVKCSTCPRVEKWSKMQGTKHYEESAAAAAEEDERPSWWSYMCWDCKAAKMDLPASLLPTEREARARAAIMESSGHIDRKKARCEAFNKAKADACDYYKALGVEMGGKRLYQVTRQAFLELFSNIADLLTLKRRAFQILQDDVESHVQLVAQLREARDPLRVRQLVEAIEAISTRPDLLAYSKGRTEEEQWSMISSSAYQDEIVSMRGGGYFRFYFICMAGGTAWRCLRMHASKKWRQAKPDSPWTTGQRWYCSCNSKYRARNGVICEVRHPSIGIFYLRAPCPDEDVLDVMAMRLERDAPQLSTPEEVYRSLPIINPTPTCLVEACGDGEFKFRSEEDLKAVPEFAWSQIYTFVETLGR